MKRFMFFLKILLVFIFCSVFCFSMLCYLTGICTISYNGFAVDYKGSLYIGFPEGKIKVFEDKQYVKTIFSGTNKGYDFTIVDGDKIYVYIAPQGYFLDLNGKRIDSPYDEYTNLREFRPDKKEFVFDDNVIYKQQFNMGRTKFIKISDGDVETIYEMPMVDYIVKVVLIMGYILAFIAGLYLFYKKITKEPIRPTNQTNY